MDYSRFKNGLTEHFHSSSKIVFPETFLLSELPITERIEYCLSNPYKNISDFFKKRELIFPGNNIMRFGYQNITTVGELRKKFTIERDCEKIPSTGGPLKGCVVLLNGQPFFLAIAKAD